MGEEHPAAKKVVVELCVADLNPEGQEPRLTQVQRNKLIKLAGVRYNPSKDTIKMSCERFETPAQNKRYLGDLVNSLIAEATDPTKDTFEDIPFDFRHYKPPVVHHFPDTWKLGGAEQVTSSSQHNVQRLLEYRQQKQQMREIGPRRWLQQQQQQHNGDPAANATHPRDTDISVSEDDNDLDPIDGNAIVHQYLQGATQFQMQRRRQVMPLADGGRGGRGGRGGIVRGDSGGGGSSSSSSNSIRYTPQRVFQ